MDPAIIAALIGLSGTILGTLIALAPNTQWFQRLTSRTDHHSMLGSWLSAWGPMPDGPPRHEEILVISYQRGRKIKGYITRAEEPGRRWEVEGRFDGYFLQLMFFPSPDEKNVDYLSHGCYFFERKANGKFIGYSTAYDEDDDNPSTEKVNTCYHELTRKTGS